jgi:multiple sugar transport system ATP-binding protein
VATVELKSVRKEYPNGYVAVEDFTLSIADGEFVVLVGPSGCGKSTTLRMIAGLETGFSGTIAIDGRVVNDISPSERDIAMVFQNYALYPHMSVRQNLGLALKLKGVARAEIDKRVQNVSQMLELTALLERKPGQLSGGQRQRVAVGRAIVREPKAFLFDEPLSNLDAKLRVSTRAELKALHARLKTTSIYVTHDQEEAMTLGDRMVVMHKGRVQQCDSPMQTYLHPVNRFVAGFVGMPPMNFVNGMVARRSAEWEFLEAGSGGFAVRLPMGSIDEAKLGAIQAGAGGAKQVVLGVRPTELVVVNQAEPGSIAMRVEGTELLGEQMDVHGVTTAGSVIVARLSVLSMRHVIPARGSLMHVVLRSVGGQDTTADLASSGGGGVHVFEMGEMGRNLAADQPRVK